MLHRKPTNSTSFPPTYTAPFISYLARILLLPGCQDLSFSLLLLFHLSNIFSAFLYLSYLSHPSHTLFSPISPLPFSPHAQTILTFPDPSSHPPQQSFHIFVLFPHLQSYPFFSLHICSADNSSQLLPLSFFHAHSTSMPHIHTKELVLQFLHTYQLLLPMIYFYFSIISEALMIPFLPLLFCDLHPHSFSHLVA